MTAPALAAGRLAAACLMGLGLGLWYGFLRPLRPKFTLLSDLLFLLALFPSWVYLGFGICEGDLRLGYIAGLALGGFLWEFTAGRVLRPVFAGFWRAIFQILWWFCRPFQKFFKKTHFFAKKLFAYAKKSVTIEGRNLHSNAKGGLSHGKAAVTAQANPVRIPPQQQHDQDRGHGGASAFHGRPAGASRRHHRSRK
jgi:hypothetical protein